MRLLLAALLLLSFALTSPAWADALSRDSQRAALMAVLEAPHPQFDAKSLRRIGPDVQSLLIEQASSTQTMSPVRLRALGALQFFPNAASRAVLLEAIGAINQAMPVLRVALSALAAGFGVEALPVLQQHLHHSNVFIREATAYALGDLDDPRVTSLLENRVQHEPAAAVRDAMVASLQRIAKRAQTQRK